MKDRVEEKNARGREIFISWFTHLIATTAQAELVQRQELLPGLPRGAGAHGLGQLLLLSISREWDQKQNSQDPDQMECWHCGWRPNLLSTALGCNLKVDKNCSL